MSTDTSNTFTMGASQIGLMSLANKFNTGNPFLDFFVCMAIGGVMTAVVDVFKELCSYSRIKYQIDRVVRIFGNFLARFKSRPENFTKEVIINYYDDSRNKNELYIAMDWYLTDKYSDDLKNDTPLEYFYSDDIRDHKDEVLDTRMRVPQNKYKTITYKDHEICYLLDKKIEDVYAPDKKKQRENRRISLSCSMKKNEQDILNDFSNHVLNEYKEKVYGKEWRQQIYTNNKEGKWDSQNSNNRRKLDTVVLQDNQLAKIKNDIHDFIESKDWYYDRDIPYTRGYLFHGEPGTGKTSLIKGMSTQTQRHIHYLMLDNVIDDEQLLTLMKGIDYTKTILVIEDVDCISDIIKDRNIQKNEDLDEFKKEIKEMISSSSNSSNNHPNINYKSNLTLSGLLNALDGVFNNDGRILIMTTNHPEVLDRALIRPGRIDMRIEFAYCNHQQIIDIFKIMFDEEIDISHLENVDEYKYSPAFITSLLMNYKNSPYEAFDHIEEFYHNNGDFDFISKKKLKPE